MHICYVWSLYGSVQPCLCIDKDGIVCGMVSLALYGQGWDCLAQLGILSPLVQVTKCIYTLSPGLFSWRKRCIDRSPLEKKRVRVIIIQCINFVQENTIGLTWWLMVDVSCRGCYACALLVKIPEQKIMHALYRKTCVRVEKLCA